MPINPNALWLLVGFSSLTVIWIPLLLNKKQDLFSVWNFGILSIFLAVTLRNIFIYFTYPNTETINFLYLLGHQVDYFLRGSTYYLICLASIVVGYMLVTTRRRKRLTVTKWSRTKLYLLVFVLTLVSVASTYLYVSLSGGFGHGLSVKRQVSALGNIVASHGALKYLASLAIFSHLLVLADIISVRTPLRKARILLAFFLFLLACFVPFYSSSRTPVAIYFIVTCAVLYYSSKRFPIVRFVAIVVVLITTVSAMSALRSLDHGAGDTFIHKALKIPKAFVLNRGEMGVPKTAHLIQSVPTELDWKYGSTFMQWSVAWIPRRFWANKPMIGRYSKVVGRHIYGNSQSGVPPGLVGELFWNFGLLGLVFGGMAVGAMIKYVYQRFRPSRDRYGRIDPFIAAAYAIGPMWLGFSIFGHSLGYGIFHTMMNSLAILGCLILIKSRRTRVLA